MSADVMLLREVATQMREHHPISHPRHEMWMQMAHLLEQAALADSDLQSEILAVARAYQSAVERPDVS